MVNHRSNQLALRAHLLTQATVATYGTDQFAWENIQFSPPDSVWLEEEYLPGPMFRATLSTNGELECLPMYVIKVHGPANTGLQDVAELADELIAHFEPGTQITNSQSEVLRVRGDVAPSRGQLLRVGTMEVVITVTVPLRLRTTN